MLNKKKKKTEKSRLDKPENIDCNWTDLTTDKIRTLQKLRHRPSWPTQFFWYDGQDEKLSQLLELSRSQNSRKNTVFKNIGTNHALELSTRVGNYTNCSAEQLPRGDCKAGNTRDPMHETWSQYGDGSSTFSSIPSLVRMKELHLMALNSKRKLI